MESTERILRHPGLVPLWKSLEREHLAKQVTALVLVVLGLSVCFFTVRTSAVLPFAGSLLACLGLYWLFRLLGERPAAAWQEQLRNAPERYVWVYGLVTERMPFGLNLMRSATLYLVEADGKVHDFSLPAGQLLLVTKTLNRLLPHAEFGYTEERELRYRGELNRLK